MLTDSGGIGNSNYQWRIPLILEAFFPVLCISTIYFLCPESPRYLVLKGRREEARKVIAKYMTTHDDVDAPIVPLIMQQIEESIESSRTGKWAAYDYRVFFTKAAGYRTFVLTLYSIFQQWNGGAIISYYLSPALDTIGITAAVGKHNYSSVLFSHLWCVPCSSIHHFRLRSSCLTH